MNKVHKINGFVYVTSEEKPKENQYGIGYAIGIKGVGAKFYLFFHDGSSRGKINAICKYASTVILTNDTALIGVQHLTTQEVDYLNTVDECEVCKEKYSERFDTDKSPIGNYETWGNRYKLQLPKKNFYCGDEVDYGEQCGSQCDNCVDVKGVDYGYLPKQETIEEVANKYSGYHKSYIDKTDVKGSAFLDGYNHALNTLYTAQQVTEYAYYFEKCYAERPMKKPLLPTDYFNQNKKKCKHQNINRVDGLDECLDCGTKNH